MHLKEPKKVPMGTLLINSRDGREKVCSVLAEAGYFVRVRESRKRRDILPDMYVDVYEVEE